MGIPGLFASLRKRITGFVKDNIDQDIDYLYIDGNTFLHRQCGGVAVKYGPNADKNKVLDEMCQECINYVLHLVEKVQPKKEVFLAIDGVAPMGKMKQQRHRRFMSVVDKKLSIVSKENLIKKNISLGIVIILLLVHLFLIKFVSVLKTILRKIN